MGEIADNQPNPLKYHANQSTNYHYACSLHWRQSGSNGKTIERQNMVGIRLDSPILHS